MRPLSTPALRAVSIARGGFVEPLFEQGVLGSRQQPLVHFGESGARIRIGGIARLRLQIEFQRIVAGGLVSRFAAERRGGAREQRAIRRARPSGAGRARSAAARAARSSESL